MGNNRKQTKARRRNQTGNIRGFHSEYTRPIRRIKMEMTSLEKKLSDYPHQFEDEEEKKEAKECLEELGNKLENIVEERDQKNSRV